ncbi:MAG: 16S rRNA (guanine(966)-N(2))-methyltransferase RsmD [Methylococcales bacterium]|nr:16S rRNA (guanine(966)-N(2))-methyltransferase RsmD [Methylococcales bacterium]MDD5753849.1 16S rRNA (guanine(966)-N(2))-methyltransferase RsmD [Methylococcales bacterium]
MSKVKIIGGQWRSRQIDVLDAEGLRPTPNRVRETLFNWLQADIFNSRCLDLFAGSGALSFEAASRGAKTIVQVENNVAAYGVLKLNVEKLGATQIQTVQSDALSYLAKPPVNPFDIIFIDPPFGLDLVAKTCELLEKQNWLTPYSKIYVETETDLTFELPERWQLLKSKVAGEVAYRLFEIR